MRRGVLKRIADGGAPRHVFAVLLEAFHRAEGEAQRERGVRICFAAAGLEQGAGDLGVGLGELLIDLLFVGLAQLAGAWIDDARHLDHRIVRGVDRRLAPFAELLAHGDIAQPGAAHQLRGPLLRRLAGEDLLDQRIVGAHRLQPMGQRVGQFDRLQVLVDRRFGVQLLLERLEIRLAILAQPLRVRLGLLIGQAQQRPGGDEQSAVEGLPVEHAKLDGKGTVGGKRFLDGVPRIAVLRLELWIALHFPPQCRFGVRLLFHDGRVLQAGDAADIGFASVLHAEQIVVRAAVVLQTALRVRVEQHLAAPQQIEIERVRRVAVELQIGHRVEAAGAAGMPGNEHQLPVLRAGSAPLQVIRGLDRLAVLVRAEEADVQVIARILEVVGIAAEEGDGQLRREDQPHVRVFLVPVEVVLASLEQSHDIAAQSGLLQRLLLDRAHHRAPGALRVGGGHARLYSGLHALRDVLGTHQNIQLQVDALHFLRVRLGVVAGSHVIVFGCRDLCQAVQADVVVGENQTVRPHERARAAVVEPHGGLLQVVEPGLRRLESVALLEESTRRVVEEPHAFIGNDRYCEQSQG